MDLSLLPGSYFGALGVGSSRSAGKYRGWEQLTSGKPVTATISSPGRLGLIVVACQGDQAAVAEVLVLLSA
jgi:hypothetical protein